KTTLIHCLTLVIVAVVFSRPAGAAYEVIRSVNSGQWSAAATWEGGQVPAAGARVLIRPGHTVTYDVASEMPIRTVQIGGTLTFAPIATRCYAPAWCELRRAKSSVRKALIAKPIYQSSKRANLARHFRSERLRSQ